MPQLTPVKMRYCREKLPTATTTYRDHCKPVENANPARVVADRVVQAEQWIPKWELFMTCESFPRLKRF
jgi:hypothetical protein